MIRGAISAVRPAHRRAETLHGTGRLVRLILRRDRVRLSLWIVGLVVLMAVSAQSIDSLYATDQQIRTYVDTVSDNPALVIFAGPGYGFDEPSRGAILVNETALWMALGCALMSLFLVNRHTRAEEDNERADLVRSLIVGRHAPAAATLIVAIGANVVVASGCAVATLLYGYPPAGALALCAGIGAVGIAFAASTSLTVQIASTGRSALGLGATLIALAFVVRGVGDIGAPWLSWFTPFGWGIGIRAFAGERWWTLLGLAGFAAAFVVAALAASVRRDLGSGFLAQRAGRAEASAWTRRPVGLAIRLQRGPVIGWAVGLAIGGLVYGSVADDIEEMIADNPDLADFLARTSGATLTEAYLATSLRLLALVTAGFAVSSALRNRAEEASGHAESMLATPLSRWRWAGGQLAVTVGATVLLVLVTGVSIGIGYAVSVDDPSAIATLTAASLATLPAVLVLVGVATLLFGWFPHATTAAWVVFAVVCVIDVFAEVLRLPHWLRLVSPLEHAPSVPAESWAVTPIVALCAVALTMVVAGLVGFRRRDLA
jgi:ABC-2 type transport system permease protein